MAAANASRWSGLVGERVRFGNSHRRAKQTLAKAIVESLEPRVLLSSSYTVTNTQDSGPGSLRAAILNADAGSGIQAITFASTVTGTIALSGSALTIDNTSGTVTIDGPGAGSLTINAQGLSGVFVVASDSTAELDGLQITGGYSGGADGCGGIENLGDLTVTNSTITANSAKGGSGYGGGIYNVGTLFVNDSTISNNSATYYGGGIWNTGTATISNSTINANSVNSVGGGVYNGGTLTLTASTVAGNTANYGGGGIYNYPTAEIMITDSTLSGNSTPRLGGGIYGRGTMKMMGSTVSGNSAACGGGFYLNGGATITDSTITGNSVSTCGGGIDNLGSLAIAGSTLNDNFATNNSGRQASGGGIYNLGTLTVADSTFNGNSTGSNGGGIYNAAGLTITNSTLSGNSALTAGGGIYSSPQYTTKLYGTIVANSGTLGGDLSGSFIGSYNLIDDGTWVGTGLTTANKNILGSSSNAINPLLTSLGNYGGTTQTMALLPGSPAIDAGAAFAWPDSNPITTDQRGLPRPQGSTSDIGAYQLQPLADLPTGTSPVPGFSYSTPASLGGTLPAGVNIFNPPVDVSAGAATGSPDIAASSLTAGPNDTVTVTGNELSRNSGKTDGTAYSDTQFLVYGESGGVGTLAPAQIQDTLNTASSSAGGALVTIPSSEPGDSMYLIWAENADGATTPIAINQTDAQWFSLIPSTTAIFSLPSQTTGGVLTTFASPGQTVYVYGRNLSNGTTSWVYLENTAATAGEYAAVSSVNPYQVEFTLPGNLPSGQYHVWVNNGLGGKYSWSEAPGIISTTQSATAFPTQGQAGWFDVTASPYNTDNTGKNDAYPGIEAALSGIATYRNKAGNANAPVTLYFPAGLYNVKGNGSGNEQIRLPSNIQVLGASRTGTTLEFAQDATTGYGPFDIGFNDSVANPYTNVEYNSLTITYYGPQASGDLIREQFGQDLVMANVTLNSQSLEAVDFFCSKQVTVMNSSIIGGGGGDELYAIGTQNVTIMNDVFSMEFDTETPVNTGANSNFAFFDSTVQDYNDSLNAQNLPNDPNGWGQGRLVVGNALDGNISNEYIGGNQTINLGSPTRVNGGEQVLFENGARNDANGQVESVSGNTIVLPLSAEMTVTGTTVSASQNTGTRQTTVVGNFGGVPAAGEILLYEGQLLTIGSVTAGSSGNLYTLTLQGLFAADPAQGNSLVIVNPPSSGQSAIVANGTGMGQIATVQSVVQGIGSVTLTLSGGLRIPLDTSSVIATSNTVTNSVIYNNTLQDQTGPYGATAAAGPTLTLNGGLGAAGGVQLFNGAYNIVIDSNTIENTNGGIVLYGSNAVGSGAVSYFIDVTNNTMENVHEVGIYLSPNAIPGDLADVGVNVRGNTIEWNDSTIWSDALTLNAHMYYGLGDGDTEPTFVNPDDTQNPTGIIIGGSVPDEAHIDSAAFGTQWTPGQTTATLSVVEHNVVTTAISGQSALGLGVFQDPDVFVYQNAFNAGTAPATSVPAVAFCDLYSTTIGVSTQPQALLLGNTYENYSQSYVEPQFTGAQDDTPSEGSLPAQLLQTPFAFTLAAPAGQYIELSLPILDDGASALSWSATSSSSSLTFLASSGSIDPESSGSAVLLIDTSTAGSGTYTVTISDGGQEKKISIYLTVF